MPGSVALLGGLTTLPSEPQDDRRTDDAERRCDHSRATGVLAARKREGLLARVWHFYPCNSCSSKQEFSTCTENYQGIERAVPKVTAKSVGAGSAEELPSS
jgi:hypothetical protein